MGPGFPEVRVELRSFLPGSEISELNSEQVFHPRQWRVSRKRVRSGTPVLGRWSGSTPSDWPSVLADIQRLWPMGGDADVRLFGRPTRALEALGTKHLPASWIAFNEREISRRTFYRSLDFFVHFTGRSQSPKLELPVLEALAAGCVVVLPEPAEKLYGDAALYAAPEDVSELVEGYHSDPSRFLEQSRRGVEFAETLGVGAQAQYTQLVSRLLQSTSSDEQERVSL